MSYTNGLDKPSDYFSTKLYSGNGGTQSIIGIGFSPSWVWIKSRTSTANHNVIDVVRGVNKELRPDVSNAEEADNNNISSLDSDGWTMDNDGKINGSGNNYVSWNWKAGTSFTNDASSTGIGTIDSTGSASDASGFSIVSYSGTGGAGTIKHGLSTTPSMIIVKVRTGRTSDWLVYHKGIASDAQTDCIKLNESGASFDEATIWNDTAPTSSVFSVGTEDTVSGSGNTFIAYCFAEKKGYSKFGSYVGNGSNDGIFCFTGMKTSFVMVKRTDATNQWMLIDNKRTPSNTGTVPELFADLSSAENNSTDGRFDFLSNGLKARGTNAVINASGGTYIYMAFAESPFVTSTGVPATAR